jgi:hypothetical protein
MKNNNLVFNKYHYFILTEPGPDKEDVYVCRYAWVKDQAQCKGHCKVLGRTILRKLKT